MSPPNVWGPAIWTLFHTLAEKVNPSAYSYIHKSMFDMFVRICKYLPCPECSVDASNFLAKININNYKTKEQFKDMLYLFHNYVNAKKRKPLFNHQQLIKYRGLPILAVINNFLIKYNTKGNMKMLADSFQRSLVISEFTYWFKLNYIAFVNPVQQYLPIGIEEPQKIEKPSDLTTIQEISIKKEEINNNVVEEIPITKEDIEIAIDSTNEPFIEEKTVSKSKKNKNKKQKQN